MFVYGASFLDIALNVIRRDTSIDASIKSKRHMSALIKKMCVQPWLND